MGLGMTRRFGLRRRGLSLVEMLVVIAVCAALAGLMVPMILRSRESARTVLCADNLKGIGQTYALCLMQANGTLPSAYYTFTGGQGGAYQIALRTVGSGAADSLLSSDVTRSLVCPDDEKPVNVVTLAKSGQPAAAPTSYAYNVALPLSYCNLSRVSQPGNTVSFYDGNAAGVDGTSWQATSAWAPNTVQYRHSTEANFLFLDGHVQHSGTFPDASFLGGPGSPAAPQQLQIPPPSPTGHSFAGAININPSNGGDDFSLTLPNGTVITRDDLKNNTVFTGAGFSSGKLEYTGPATVVYFKPKGSGNKNSLTEDGQPYPMSNGTGYNLSSKTMTVHLYNSKGNGMGQWYVTISATNATMQTY